MNQNDIEAMIQRYMENLSESRQGRQEWERRLAALITRRRGHPGYRLARF